MSTSANDASNSTSPKDESETPSKPSNIIERIGWFREEHPEAKAYVVMNESEARELLTALSATYTAMINKNPPPPKAMAQALQAIREMDEACIKGGAFKMLEEMLIQEPMEFAGLKIKTSQIVRASKIKKKHLARDLRQ